MTENYFIASAILLILAICDLIYGWFWWFLIIFFMVMGFLSGYGVLPEWKG